jgi:transcriptional regulator with XRE-family HTH domain
MIDLGFATPDELCKELGARLRTQRLAQRLTQEGLASRAGVYVGTVQNVEAKGGTPSLESVVRVALALGLADQFQSLFCMQTKSIAQMEQAEAPKRRRARPVKNR